MRRLAIEYGSALILLLALDAVWLSLAVPSLYRPRLRELLLPQPVLWAAILFYLLYSAGVVMVALIPTRGQDWTAPLLAGAVLGLVAYGTYDLTNQATLRDWSPLITALDMAWGTILTALAAAGAAWIAARWG